MIALTATDKYIWTEPGRQRVGAAITATLAYNRSRDIYPRSIRELSKEAGFRNHTSLGEYARGGVADPNREDCRVLKAIARYIYRVQAFHVSDAGGMSRFKDTQHVQPTQKSDIAHLRPRARLEDGHLPRYWDQDCTYTWRELAALGTIAGDRLEIPLVQPTEENPLSSLLLDRIRRLPRDRQRLIAQLLDIPPSTLRILSRDMDLNKAEFTDMAQVICDFLARITPQKPAAWTLDQLVAAISPAANITRTTLERVMAGEPCGIEIPINLSQTFKSYGVDWEVDDLRVIILLSRGGGGEPIQGDLFHHGNGVK